MLYYITYLLLISIAIAAGFGLLQAVIHFLGWNDKNKMIRYNNARPTGVETLYIYKRA